MDRKYAALRVLASPPARAGDFSRAVAKAGIQLFNLSPLSPLFFFLSCCTEQKATEPTAVLLGLAQPGNAVEAPRNGPRSAVQLLVANAISTALVSNVISTCSPARG